jgi:hypothetical protein
MLLKKPSPVLIPFIQYNFSKDDKNKINLEIKRFRKFIKIIRVYAQRNNIKS